MEEERGTEPLTGSASSTMAAAAGSSSWLRPSTTGRAFEEEPCLEDMDMDGNRLGSIGTLTGALWRQNRGVSEKVAASE